MPGTALTFKALHLDPSSVYTITWAPGEQFPVQTAANGRIGYASTLTFTVPMTLTPAGGLNTAYGFTLSGLVGGITTALTARVVIPQQTASLTPSQGDAGTIAQVVGTDFGMGENITITLRSSKGAIVAHSATTADGSGSFGPADLPIPVTTPPGIYTATIFGAITAMTVRANFPVSAHHGVRADPGPAGGMVEASGRSSGAGESVSLSWSTTTTLGSSYADATGRVSDSVMIPAWAPNGPHAIVARGAQSKASVTTIYTVTGTVAHAHAHARIHRPTPHQHGDPHAIEHARAHAHAHSDEYPRPDQHAHAARQPDIHTTAQPHARTARHANRHGSADKHADRDAQPFSDANVHADGFANGYADRYPNLLSNRYSVGHAHRQFARRRRHGRTREQWWGCWGNALCASHRNAAGATDALRDSCPAATPPARGRPTIVQPSL